MTPGTRVRMMQVRAELTVPDAIASCDRILERGLEVPHTVINRGGDLVFSLYGSRDDNDDCFVPYRVE